MNKPLKITLISVGCLAVAFLLLVAYLYFDGPYRLGHLRNRLFWSRPGDTEQVEKIPARRGDILTHDGKVLSTDIWLYDVHLDCTVIKDEDIWADRSRALALAIAPILPEKTAPEWWSYFQDAREKGNRYIALAKNVDREVVDTLHQLPLLCEGRLKGGYIVEAHEERSHPYAGLARRTIGYTRSGRGVGLEGGYHEQLAGVDGERKVRYGVRKGQLEHREIGRTNPIDGYNLYSTLDIGLQQKADSALHAQIDRSADIDGACLVLMEVGTGAIRAMVNLSRADDGSFREAYNFAIGRSYEPGAVVSTMTLAAALQDGLVKSIDDAIPTNHGVIPGMTVDQHIVDYERANHTMEISLLNGFKQSSNYVMASVARRYGESLKYYTDWIHALCLPDRLDFDLEGLRDADIFEPDTAYWSDNTLASMGCGYAFTVSPLHILSFYNTIASGGKMMKPYLVERLLPRSGKAEDAVERGPEELTTNLLRPEVTAEITRALVACTEDGTAKVLKEAKYSVAGKTGTARQIIKPSLQADGGKDPYTDSLGRHQYAATFAGFFPADAPQYSVICTVFTDLTVKTYYGGDIPAKAVRELVDIL